MKATIVKTIDFKGVKLTAPALYIPPEDDNFHCCGPGYGIKELIIPETILGVRITIACHIHDYSWEISPADRRFYRMYNKIFYHNMKSIIAKKSNNCIMRKIRTFLARKYYRLVSSRIGEYEFWEIKKRQGLIDENPLAIQEDIL